MRSKVVPERPDPTMKNGAVANGTPRHPQRRRGSRIGHRGAQRRQSLEIAWRAGGNPERNPMAADQPVGRSGQRPGR
jgi:hypothetical protein